MGAIHRDADAGAGDFEGRQAEDLPALVEHFHLFPGVAVFGEDIDLRDDIECDLTRVDFRGKRGAGGDGADLLLKFDDTAGTGAGNRLVGGGDHGFEAEGIVERGEGHQGDDGGAVRIRDDVPGTVGSGVRINFRDYERDIPVHAEGGGIINDHGTGGGGVGSELRGDATSRAEQGDINIGKRVRGEFLDPDFRAAESDFFPGGTGGGKKGESAEFKIPLLEAKQHFRAHGSRGSDNCNAR